MPMKVKHVGQSSVYHTTDCDRLEAAERSITEMDKELAEAWGYEICFYCENPEAHTLLSDR